MSHQNLLHDSADELGPIRVFDDGQYRILSFAEGDEQSRIRLSTPHILQHEYTQAMMLPLLFCEPKRVCILGLGGGTLLHALHHTVPAIHITAVELRQEVMDAAEMYFKLPKGKRITLDVANAIDYIAAGLPKKVDILMTDLYNTEGMDRSVLQASFIEHCANNIKEEGWLALNCWVDHKNNQALIDIIKQHFNDVRALDTGSGNWVIIAGKRMNHDNAKELKASAQKLSDKMGFQLTKWLLRCKSL
ncbi:spermidine synthase [Marinomonas sp. M1K-6]|uniref:Spermidine synthase n=1 Tax=Marinomonas profundi TaxID=2726122 RepID=A0A847QZJ7_9GAMM|nr:spermidine synthase [Marinomonas profundi]NLQ16332.1 spermidine synthase [Marinomonas profundi]UDV03093.1 spermidine synthase [Marinomonas profundi]